MWQILMNRYAHEILKKHFRKIFFFFRFIFILLRITSNIVFIFHDFIFSMLFLVFIRRQLIFSSFCRRFGKLSEVWVASYPPLFAFVVFKNKSDANEALAALNNT